MTNYQLLLFFMLSLMSLSIQLPLCCPKNFSVITIQSDSFLKTSYKCERIQYLNDSTYVETKESRIYNWDFSNNQIDEEYINLPKCKEDYIMKLLPNGFVNLPKYSCLTTFNGMPAVLYCSMLALNNTEEFIVVQKCCPSDYIFSSKENKCVLYDMNLDIPTIYLNYPILLTYKNMNCPLNKVLVEYTLDSSMFTLNKNKMVLKESGREFNMNKFCMETVFDTDSLLNVKSLNYSKFLIRTCDSLDICSNLACIRKCCDDGELYEKRNGSTVCKSQDYGNSFESFKELEISANFSKPEVYGFLRGLECPKFRLDPDSFSDEAHTISPINGSLHINNTKKLYTNNQYCIEKIYKSPRSNQKMYTFLCFDSKVVDSDQFRFKIYPIGLLISCCFYLATLVVYLSVPKLRNLPGKILICLVCSLFLAYLGIALGQLMPTSNNKICFASGFFVYFCLIAAFSWMNVMCFDIWQTFGTAKNKRGLKKKQTRRFVCYSVYGWGLPCLLTSVTVTLTVLNILDKNIRPNFGHGRCWFTYDSIGFASLIFFSGPVGLLFLINLILFILTLRYCNKVKREIFRMQSSNCDKPILRRRFFVDKARFTMNAKLCFVMGITWLLELLSIIFYDHKKMFFWAISDSFNVLLGVFVFFIFVFKKRIWYAVLNCIGLKEYSERKRTTATAGLTHSSYASQNRVLTAIAVDPMETKQLRKYQPYLAQKITLL